MLSNDIPSSLPSAFPKSLTDASHLVSLTKNEILFQPNDDVDSIFYIVEGEPGTIRTSLSIGWSFSCYDEKFCRWNICTCKFKYAVLSLFWGCYEKQ